MYLQVLFLLSMLILVYGILEQRRNYMRILNEMNKTKPIKDAGDVPLSENVSETLSNLWKDSDVQRY